MPSKKFTEKAVRSAALPLASHDTSPVVIGGLKITRVGPYTGTSLGNVAVGVAREGGAGDFLMGRFNVVLPRLMHHLNFPTKG